MYGYSLYMLQHSMDLRTTTCIVIDRQCECTNGIVCFHYDTMPVVESPNSNNMSVCLCNGMY